MTDDMFGAPTVDDVPLSDQIEAVQREIDLRMRVYPKWVEAGKMTESASQSEILRMCAVLQTLKYVMDTYGR